MADNDGVALSLADYIKVKRKQGSFKVGRGGAKAQPQSGGRGKGRVLQQRRNKPQKGIGNQGQQQQRRNRQGVGGRFNNQVAISPRQRQNPNPRRKNQRFRGLKNLNAGVGARQNRPQTQQVGGRNRNTFPRRQNQVALRGISQNLMRGGRRGGARVNRNIPPLMTVGRNQPRIQIANRTRGGQARPNNRRVVQKLAQKRVQRARLQLARPRVGVSTGRRLLGKGRLQGLGVLSSRPGIKLSRNGFITVRSPVEKQLQRLVVQDKIKRARQNRNRINQQNRSPNRPAPLRDSGLRIEVPNDRRRRYPQTRPQRQSPLRPVRSYDPYEPMMGTMYADEVAHASSRGRSDMRANERYSPPLVRTATNTAYRGRTQEDYDFYGLNPEIQKKITFIQNRNRITEPPGIIPDFRAPIQSSTIKLGDRFRMYMQ